MQFNTSKINNQTRNQVRDLGINLDTDLNVISRIENVILKPHFRNVLTFKTLYSSFV